MHRQKKMTVVGLPVSFKQLATRVAANHPDQFVNAFGHPAADTKMPVFGYKNQMVVKAEERMAPIKESH